MLKATALIATALGLLINTISTEADAKRNVSAAQQCPGHVQGVYYYRGMTRSWQRKMNVAPTRSEFNASLVRSCPYTIWVAHRWQHRASKWHVKYIRYNAYLQEQQKLREQRRVSVVSVEGYAPLCGASCVACESGFNPNAWNAAGYWGWYQFDYGTWVAHGGIPSHWGKSSTSSGEQTAIASRVRYDAWPNC